MAEDAGDSDPTAVPVPDDSAGRPEESARQRRRASFGPAWLRALLSVPFALLVQLLAFACLLAPLLLVAPDLTSGLDGAELLLTAATYLVVCPVLWGAWALLTGDSLRGMGHAGPPRRALRQALVGFAGGVLLLSGIVGLGALLGAWTIEGGEGAEALRLQALWLPALLLAAYAEELLLRGWVLQDFGRRSPLAGLLLSSAVFALLHGANPNLRSEGSAQAALALANIFLAGLLLGSLFLLTGRLWLSTGLHLGWNWTVAVLFGLPVSGFDLPSFLEGRAVGGTGALSGGGFGPEASLPALALMAPVALTATILALRRGCRVPAVARRDRADEADRTDEGSDPPSGAGGAIIAPHPDETEPVA